MSRVAISKVTQEQTDGFVVRHEVVLPGSPEVIFDVLDGDVSGWWDHTFSESPVALYIEAKPGGGFYELFDEAGNGVQHARVIAAHRGKLLRMVGPLGFSGEAISMVHTFSFESDGENTRLGLTVKATGMIEEGWAEAVDGVWHHFLVEQLKPYVESGQHRNR